MFQMKLEQYCWKYVFLSVYNLDDTVFYWLSTFPYISFSPTSADTGMPVRDEDVDTSVRFSDI